ncbi:hypothetical protein Acr_22g0009750 [Actinidia rufa]|uniref:Uncharacterized protein n=1 Tax=Actinidia rufa TaxID=165716 RepID=A0A7J0GL79_9ERIC|nr:hypothetical protein Acr_22g0009750 [Actinidia rufa]
MTEDEESAKGDELTVIMAGYKEPTTKMKRVKSVLGNTKRQKGKPRGQDPRQAVATEQARRSFASELESLEQSLPKATAVRAKAIVITELLLFNKLGTITMLELGRARQSSLRKPLHPGEDVGCMLTGYQARP